jgi:hypothetical protein
MSWKEHPTAIAATSIAATLTFCVTVIIPIWDKEKDNRIRDLSGEPAKLKTELADLGTQIEIVESENRKLRRDLDKLVPDALFATDNVYPHGYREVHIGDRVAVLEKVYGGRATLEDADDWISVRFRAPDLFSQITYYFDRDASKKIVTHILFHFADPVGEIAKTFRQALIDKYGQKGMKQRTSKLQGSEIYWENVASGYDVDLADTNYHIGKHL